MFDSPIVLTGDYSHVDFADVLSSSPAPLTLVPWHQLFGKADSQVRPRLVAIACSRRGQWTRKQVDEVWHRFQPTPVIGLHGSWCEGELRSGQAWPGIPRVYWHQWHGQVAQLLHCLESGRMHSWHLPRTATPADVAWEIPATPVGDRRIVAVMGRQADERQTLLDALAGLGWDSREMPWLESSLSPMAVPADSEPDVLLLATAGLDVGFLDSIQRLTTKFPAVPLVVVLNFPRYQDRQLLRDLGVAQLIAKPFALPALQAALISLLKPPLQQTA